MTNEEKEIDKLKFKNEQQRLQINVLLSKIKTLEEGKPKVHKNMLGLVPKKLYLILTNGRRITGKVEFETEGFIAYTKREGTMYYANKLNCELIKELNDKEQKSYLKSNFGEIYDEDNV